MSHTCNARRRWTIINNFTCCCCCRSCNKDRAIFVPFISPVAVLAQKTEILPPSLSLCGKLSNELAAFEETTSSFENRGTSFAKFPINGIAGVRALLLLVILVRLFGEAADEQAAALASNCIVNDRNCSRFSVDV